MASTGRDASCDRDRTKPHHIHTNEAGKSISVPMWDSSDPDRAPPPLPLNTSASASSSPTKPNTSAGIAAAAKAIVEKARESAPISSYISNHGFTHSSDKQLIKGAHHRRFQSLQTGNVKDLRAYLDNNRSPDKSPERSRSRNALSPIESRSRDHSRDDVFNSPERAATPTPSSHDFGQEPTRYRPRSFMGESTPPSATMLALQTMQVPETPIGEYVNRPSTPSGTPTRIGNTYDFSSQLLNLTTIATNLQKEMASLSRRSKDNATDLVSLKEATSQRDEDIRKSLRDLTTQFQSSGPSITASLSAPRSISNFADAKLLGTPPSATKQFNVPRASSVHSSLDETRLGSPSPFSVEGAASVAMLEKIIREMVTKEGQERLLENLSEILEKSREENVDAARKVEELSEFIKTRSESQALIAMPAQRELPPQFPQNAADDYSRRASLDSDTTKLLTRIKDSITHVGGTSSETKGLVRDLRGEVLGMGRELGRKLEQLNDSQLNKALEKSVEHEGSTLHGDEVQRIVEESMVELKEHISQVFAQHLKEATTSRDLASSLSGPSSENVFAIVKHALSEQGNGMSELHRFDNDSAIGMDRDSVIDAVREGLKDFEPNIELQQFGLEREEILTAIKEGLESRHRDGSHEEISTTFDKGEVYEVMQEALRDFRAPLPSETLDRLREDILSGVQAALEQHRPGMPSASFDNDALRAAMEVAVKEGLATHGPAAPRELEISRKDLFDAVKSSLDGSTIPFGSFGEQVLQQMHELVDRMRTEFKQYSAANGRDTEQVLDAVKDGLENLRGEIENYVDRAQDVTGKDEIVDTVRGGLEQLRIEVQGYCAQGPSTEKSEALDYIKSEFEHVHEAMSRLQDRHGLHAPSQDHTAAIILAVKEGMENLQSHITSRNRSLDGDEYSEETAEALKLEFEQLKAAILNAHAIDKSEIMETIQDTVGALHSRVNGSEAGHATEGMVDEILQEIQAEFAALKEMLHANSTGSERGLATTDIQKILEDLRVHLAADQTDASAESLGVIREELEAFRASFATSLVPGGQISNETMDTIRSQLAAISDAVHDNGGVPDDLLEAMHGEFEKLRTSMAHGGLSNAQSDEMLETVRLGLDDLRSHIDRTLDKSSFASNETPELLDAINDGLENLKTEIVKTLDKPLDMTVNYEILDLLREGLTALRADVDGLKNGNKSVLSGEIVLADAANDHMSREVFEAENKTTSGTDAYHDDVEALGILIHQLQIKVEAMNVTLQDMPTTQPQPTDTGIITDDKLHMIETTLKDVRDGMDRLVHQDHNGVARKEDVDALETLLRNTKSQLEDIQIALPQAQGAGSGEQLEALEAIARVTQDAVLTLSEKTESSTAAKADVAVVEVLVQDIKAAVEEIREEILPGTDRMTKADLDVLGVICTDIKTNIEEMSTEKLANKSDLETLTQLVSDFRESHDKLRESYETDIAVTAKAFDDRKTEFEATVTQIDEVKDALTEVKSDILLKLSDHDSNIDTLGETLKGIEEKLGGHEPLLEAVKQEFGRAQTSLDSIKVDHKEAWESHKDIAIEHKTAIISELGEKLESLFDGIMSKYDDAQTAATEQMQAVQDQSQRQEEVLASTKDMAEELRISIDTLGTALTTFTADYPAQMEKVAQDSQLVFTKIDDAWNKVEETQHGLKYEHDLTRGEVGKVMNALSSVQSDMLEHNPRFLIALKEVQALMTQHLDTAQKASETAEEHRQAMRALSDQLKAGFDESHTRHHEQAQELKTTLPALLAPGATVDDADERSIKMDDSALHDKLDQLLGRSLGTDQPVANEEKLDRIHEQVVTTAREVSAFLALQTQQLRISQSNSQMEAEELARLVERRTVQKEEIEDDISALNEEKQALRDAVEALKAEKETLAVAKSHLSADVSSLETALQIRREELHDMDCKAEAIERRMLEGVMNQSRLLLLSRSNIKPNGKARPPPRDLRSTSGSSARSSQTMTSSVPTLRNNHALAMKAKPTVSRSGATANMAERRIMSLNQIHHNLPNGGQAYSNAVPSLISNGPFSMSRSQSVRAQVKQRKTSWAPKRNLSMNANDKENDLCEQDELDMEHNCLSDMGDGDETTSDAGTERRTSFLSDSRSGTALDGEDDGSRLSSAYSDRLSYGTSDLSYETGSYVTESELDRRTSLGSSAQGNVDGGASEGTGESGDSLRGLALSDDRQTMQRALKQQFAPPSDSGLGTELPTAGLGGRSEYFRGGRQD